VNTVSAGVPFVELVVPFVTSDVVAAVSEVVDPVDEVAATEVAAAAASDVSTGGDVVVASLSVGSPPLESEGFGADVLAESELSLHPATTIPTPSADAPSPSSRRRVKLSITMFSIIPAR
jgi:hypothetical protein